MSKFKNPAKLMATALAPPLAPARPVFMPPAPAVPGAGAPTAPVIAKDTTLMSTLGFLLFATLLLSGYLNDWTIRLLGNKAYLSSIAVVAVPLIWIFGGNAFRGFRDTVGVLWLAFLLLMIVGIPFSFWRTGTVNLLSSYTFRSYILFFYTVSFATDLRRCRNLMLINVAAGVIVVLTCVFFGQAGTEGDIRFRIPDSIFFANSNELALQLVLNIAFFLFLLFAGGIWKAIAGSAGMLLSFVYLLKTGSRGCLISALILFAVAFAVNRRKMMVAAVALPVLLIGFLAMPSYSVRRFALLFSSGPVQNVSMADMASLESAAEREELFKRSLEYTLMHPIFGVGAGQFAVALTGDAAKNGKWAAWLGTHNSYTQVSSECGIPAFLCYAGVIFLTFRRSFGIYRAATGNPQLRAIEGLGFCIFAATLVYSVATFFFHEAYTGLLPLLSGQAVALSIVAKPILESAKAVKPKPAAPANPLPVFGKPATPALAK